MRYTLLFIVLLMFSQISKSQKPGNFEAIGINTKFKLELTKINSKEFTYRIVSKEPFNEDPNTDYALSLLDDSLKINEIQGIFASGNFGNSKSTLLIVKSGNDSPLSYNLSIDLKGNGKFKNTSTVPLNYGIPSLEIWSDYIYSIKISGFSKVDTEPSQDEFKLDTVCISKFDTYKGNILFDEQLTLLSDIISQQEKSETEKIEDFEKSIQSISVSPWGWSNELFIIDSTGRYTDTYINRRKLAQPLVFKITECPYLEREVAYFFSRNKKDVRFVVFKWSQRWVGGWQSGAYNTIESDFKNKHEFIRNSLNKTYGTPCDSLGEANRSFQTVWKTSEGVIARTYLYIDQYSRGLKLYIYKKDK